MDDRDGGSRFEPDLPQDGAADAGWCVPGVTPAPAPPPAVGPGVQSLRSSVDSLLAEPLSGRTPDLAALLVLSERLRGRALAELGECGARSAFAADLSTTAVSAAGWLRHTMTIGEDAARSTVRLAGRLRDDLPALAVDLLAGATTVEHVQALAQATAGLDPDLVRAAGPALAALTRATDPGTIRRTVRERAESIDPRLAEHAARRQHERRGLHVSPLGGAGVVVNGTLAHEDGATLLHSLDLALEAGRVEGDTRSLAARRADVVVGWARAAAHELAGPGDGLAQDAHTVRTHLLIGCSAEQLAATSRTEALTSLFGPAAGRDQAGGLGGQDAVDVLTGVVPTRPATLPTGATLLPAQLRRLACDATLTLVALAEPTGRGRAVDPLYVGRSARTISGLQFKALVVRDRTCIVKGCSARASQCAGHHVQHWAAGGLTDLDNLVLLCHRHHHDHHDRGQDLQHRDGRWLTQTGWAQAP